MSEIVKPADIQTDEITIDGQDVVALTYSIEIFENIFMSAVCGSITIMDSDGASFIEDNKIEFNEPLKFSVTGAGDSNRLTFDGVLNGLRSESTNKGNKIYVIDFTTAELRKNEESFITKRFKNEKPEDILKYCLEDKLEATEVDIDNIKGQPMELLGSRRKPFWVIKYVLTHGVVKPEAGDGQNTNKEEKDMKGMTGFLCWQTLSESGTNAYRGCDLDTLLEGGFEEHGPYDYRTMNTGQSMDTMMKSIVSYDFQTMGNIQDKMKSGAFKARVVSYDMDTGLHKEFNHDAEEEMTDKQKEIVTKNTRYMFKPFTNDKFSTTCEKAQPNTGDQSRDFLAQNNSRQNTFNDQSGTASLYPNFMVHAGDLVDFSINKTKSGSSSNMKHEKHSGKYVVKQVAHVIELGGKSYTQVSLLRSTNSEETQK